jgi:hypothetical protein
LRMSTTSPASARWAASCFILGAPTPFAQSMYSVCRGKRG